MRIALIIASILLFSVLSCSLQQPLLKGYTALDLFEALDQKADSLTVENVQLKAEVARLKKDNELYRVGVNRVLKILNEAKLDEETIKLLNAAGLPVVAHPDSTGTAPR